MTAPLDRETAELIVAEIGSLWSTPMDDLERERWRRVLRPPVGEPLDPELVGQVLLHFQHSSRGRPTIGMFRSNYDEMARQSRVASPGRKSQSGPSCASEVEPMTDRSTALEHIAGLRLMLTGDVDAGRAPASTERP